MPRLSCMLCWNQWDVSIHDVWVCPSCEMGAPDEVISFDANELQELETITRNFVKEAIVGHDDISGAVFPAFRPQSYISEELLDLLVMLFDKTILYVDTFNFHWKNGRLLDKLNAYIEKGYIETFAWDAFSNGEVGAPISKKKADLFIEPGAIDYFQKISEVQTFIDFNTISPAKLDQSLEKIAYAGGNLKQFRFAGDDKRLMYRFNAFSKLCGDLGVQFLTDELFFNLRRIKVRVDHSQISKIERYFPRLSEWYSRVKAEYPLFGRPETLIKYRDEIDPTHFLNRISHGYSSTTASADQMNIDIGENLTKALDSDLSLARKISGKSYANKKIALGGLVATLGALVGGTSGALLGGVGASAVPELAENIDRARVQSWASFFVKQA